LPRKPEHLTRLGARLDRRPDLAVQGGDLYLVTERRLRHRDRIAAVEVVALAVEGVVLLDRDLHEQIAVRPPILSRRPFASQPALLAIADAGGEVDRQRRLGSDLAIATTAVTLLGVGLPATATDAAGLGLLDTP